MFLLKRTNDSPSNHSRCVKNTPEELSNYIFQTIPTMNTRLIMCVRKMSQFSYFAVAASLLHDEFFHFDIEKGCSWQLMMAILARNSFGRSESGEKKKDYLHFFLTWSVMSHGVIMNPSVEWIHKWIHVSVVNFFCTVTRWLKDVTH